MADKKLSDRAPWYTSEFSLEGIAGAALAFVLALILGSLWSPLFWLGFIAMLIILFGTRDVKRFSPEDETLILAPCDGLVQDISDIAPPRELRMEASEVTRLRISSSPVSMVGLRAPASGMVESLLVEPGSPTAFAFDPDNPELDEAFVTIAAANTRVGMRAVTGGLGSRVKMEVEVHDSVRAGRKIGVRRLGGWCDVYLPRGTDINLALGQTVVGGETVLARMSDVDASKRAEPETVVETADEPIIEATSAPETPDYPVEKGNVAEAEARIVEDVVETKEDVTEAKTPEVSEDLPEMPETLDTPEETPTPTPAKKSTGTTKAAATKSATTTKSTTKPRQRVKATKAKPTPKASDTDKSDS